jgi:hypothetical protein
MAEMDSSACPMARTQGLAVEELDGELLIYDLDRDKAHALNPESALVWRSCDGQRSVEEIAAIVAPDADPVARLEIVWLALKQLDQRRLLLGSRDAPPDVSRRDLMRKAAMTGAVVLAIPVVRSIVAPTAAQAASCLPPGSPCTTTVQCCSGLCSGGFCVGSSRPLQEVTRPDGRRLEPACLPPGAMAANPSQCCSGAADVNGVCM